jgi:hypothetical protein
MINTEDPDFNADGDIDDFTGTDSLDETLQKDALKLKRDIRAEIEKRLELIALRKKTSDFYDDEIFN